MCGCYYYKKEGHLKPDCLKLKAKCSAKKANNATSSGSAKIEHVEDSIGERAHTMMVGGFREFNTGA